MSLYKQLWLAIILLLALVLGVSLLVTTLSAKSYLEKQLAIKNADNATALALSLGQQGADPVLMELTLAAQFDTGFYELIELSDPDGNTLVRREDEISTDTAAPGWFRRLLPIEATPGIAAVQDGWQQVGTLTLQSHSRFAYRELWETTLLLAALFLLAAIGAGVAGSMALRRILQPLQAVVAQAQAIGQRQFVTTEEPLTREFRQLVSAMNTLSTRIRSMLVQETQRLEQWQRSSVIDPVTGLNDRQPFLGHLQTILERDDGAAAGALCLVRLDGLAQLNQNYGRKAMDSLLADIGAALRQLAAANAGWYAARLNGSDFALLAPGELEAQESARDLQRAMQEVIANHALEEAPPLPGAATIYGVDDDVSELLARLDGALIAAEREQVSSVVIAHKGDIPMRPMRERLETWQTILHQAIATRSFSLAEFPVIDREGRVLHNEALARLEHAGQTLRAGEFLPWIHRLQLVTALDRSVVALALARLDGAAHPLAINLSVAAVTDSDFGNWIDHELAAYATAAQRLYIEIPEAVAFRHIDAFKALCKRLQNRGCRVGIEHLGHQLADLGALHDVGLDYLKVDSGFVRNVQNNPGNQALLRALCTIGHTIGVTMIAEGVTSDAEWQMLLTLGMDGATGPGISAQA
tara:strand:- start:870 stop:2792 length:1923 start_codon:yes stop_codon:yes gene_type:complete